MHILVTGGTGFFGKALLRYWSTRTAPEIHGARFTLLSREPERFIAEHGDLIENLDVHFVTGDIEQPETLPAGVYTHLLHAATDSSTGLFLTPLQRFNQIVNGTRHVLDHALRCGKPRVLLTSSGGVYGDISPFLEGVQEDHHGIPDPLEPNNAYSIAKRQAEHLCALYNQTYGLEYVIARCFTFIGEDLPIDAHFAIGNFIRDSLEGKEILIKGDGTTVRSYLDQRDLARWLTTLLLSGKSQRAYNVGSNEAISIAELANMVASLAPGCRPEVKVLNQLKSEKAFNRSVYIPNIDRVKNEFGLSAEIDLNSAICKVFEARLNMGDQLKR